MLKLTLIIALFSTQAQACHKFSVWHYPWKQRCEQREIFAQRTLYQAPVKAPEPGDELVISPADLAKLRAAMEQEHDVP